MKNFLLAVLGLFAALLSAPCLRAEVIDSVSFNPSRLGRYEQLKLTDGLSSQGGVNTQYMTVQSGGTVSVSNAGDYELTRSDVSGSVNMPGTRFETPDVVMKGGKGVFEQRDKSSLIKTLTSNALKIKADVLEAGTVNVKGDVHNKDYDEQDINVFKLGNNNIPKADASCARMEWVERTANDGKKYKVLAMTGCMDASLFYGPDIYAEQFTSDTCPDGDEETRSQTRFSCEAHPSYKGKCVDLFQSRFYFDYTTTYSYVDTCNGDAINRFHKEMSPAEKYHKFSCVDVYKENSPSAGSLKSTYWSCNGNSTVYAGSVINGPDASSLECPCCGTDNTMLCLVSESGDRCFTSGGLPNKAETYGSNTKFNVVQPSSSVDAICSYCKGECERVLVLNRIPGCPRAGLFCQGVTKYPIEYRWVTCAEKTAVKIVYKRSIGYRKVDCSGSGDVEGTAPEDRGA